jgi:hypothetical protein
MGEDGSPPVIIDCDQCVMQHTLACSDCVVTALVEGVAGPLELGGDEEDALDALAHAGLVAPLRLVRRPGEDDAVAR